MKKTWYEIFSGFTNPIFTKDDFNLYNEIAKEDLKFYGIHLKNNAKIFEKYRGEYPLRREFKAYKVWLKNGDDVTENVLKRFGFIVSK